MRRNTSSISFVSEGLSVMVDRDRGGRTAFGLFVPNETPEYQAAHAAWCVALGAFLHQFAEAENHLRRLLIRLAGVTEIVGRVLFHSDRVAEMKDGINRLLEATGRDGAKSALEPFFAHLTVINGVRNNIVHWGGHQLESGDYLVSNLHMAPIERARGHRVSAADLRAMTDDLASISAALLIARERVRLWGKVRFPIPYLAPQSWQYKPRPLPPLEKPQRREQTPAPKHQPSASQKTRKPAAKPPG